MFAEYLRAHFADVRSKLLVTIDKLTDADLDYRPFEGAYSVRELILHIAHEEHGEVGYGIARSLAAWPVAFDSSQYPNLESLKALLTQTHSRTEALLAGLTDGDLARAVEAPWGTKGRHARLPGARYRARGPPPRGVVPHPGTPGTRRPGRLTANSGSSYSWLYNNRE